MLFQFMSLIINQMSSDQKSPGKSGTQSPSKGQMSKNNSFATSHVNNSLQQYVSMEGMNEKQRQNIPNIQDNSSLNQQNKKLRRKLKQLSQRLDDQLQRAAQNKLKMQNLSKLQHPAKSQSQNLQLQNTYKMIQRLQKTVKDFENKQSYQISVKRIMDLESIIKKKQNQQEQLKQQIKTNKKIIREKQKHVNQLLQNAKKDKNITQDKEMIDRLKKKLKKLTEDNDMLRKKQLSKHQQLIKAERKLVQIEQDEQQPIGREESLLNQLEQMKVKYRQAMQKVQRKNIYITKLNQKLDKQGLKKGRLSQGNNSRRQVAKSLQQLPTLKKTNKVKPVMQLLVHLPSPKAAIKLRRY